MGTFEKDFCAATRSPAPDGLSPQLRGYWNREVSELATLRDPIPNEPEQERHRIFALMLMALVHEYWNGNKRGRSGTYPWNEDNSAGSHLDEDYRGHNIAAIAVNEDGHVLDFDFNHNRLFNSSAEHAEARLVRRAFALAQLPDTWRLNAAGERHAHRALDDYTTLVDITIYTSLESCAQCAGTMALGRVRRVVYLQTDPGMYFVGRILRNLTDESLRAPLPVSGGEIGLSYFTRLDNAAESFSKDVIEKPFWINADRRDNKPSITSFLCTKIARDIYGEARAEFEALVVNPRRLAYPSYRPGDASGAPIDTAMPNTEVLTEAVDFLNYAITSGQRATPHH